MARVSPASRCHCSASKSTIAHCEISRTSCAAHTHRIAVSSKGWELLGQGAQAARDTELLALTQRCHPQTLRQMRWANAMLKTLSPQVLVSP